MLHSVIGVLFSALVIVALIGSLASLVGLFGAALAEIWRIIKK